MISLAEKHPELLKQWDYSKNIQLNPFEISYGSHLVVHWKCEKDGYEWTASVKDRCIGNTGCPVCAGKIVLKNVNDFESNHPELMNEWDYELNKISPDSITPYSHVKVNWVCSKNKNHKWVATVASRTNGSGCPYCSGNKVLKGENDFETLCPELLDEWDFSKNKIKPTEISKYSTKKVWWICKKCGQSWEATVANRTFNQSGCPYCAGKKVIVGKTDLATILPNLAKEWDYSKNSKSPTEYSIGSNESVYWICKKGHSWKMRVSSRTYENQNCPYCSGKRVIAGETDLFTLYPELKKEWDFELNSHLNPEKLSAKSSMRVYWKCKLGHSWKARIADRTSGKGCPYCSGNKVLRGFNDLLTKEKELCEEWNWERNKILPSDITSGSGRKVFWKCRVCGYEWKCSVDNRVNGKTGCPNCAKKKQTSFPEKILAFYLSQVTNVEENKYVGKWNVDLLVNDKVCIEYDGDYFHKFTEEKDLRKTKYLEENGYVVIHVLGKSNVCEYVKHSDLNYEIYERNYEDFKLLISDLCTYLKVSNPDVDVKRDYDLIKEKVK